MNLDGEVLESENGYLVPVVLSVQIERQSLCVKPPEAFLRREGDQRKAQTIPQCFQRFLIKLGDCLSCETRQKSKNFVGDLFSRVTINMLECILRDMQASRRIL